jgi:hypothetical protein
MVDRKTAEPMQSEDDKGGGVSLSGDDAPGHSLPESESGAASASPLPPPPQMPPD